MIRTSARRAIVPSIAVASLLALGACGAANETQTSSNESSGEGSGLTGVLKGAGASSQEKAQEAWIGQIQGQNNGFEVQYNPIGSTDGRSQFTSGAVAYAGTDSALTDEEGELSAAEETCGSEPIQIPAYVSPIAIAFNVPDVDSINMSADTIAQIFDGKITNWNDEAIAADNEGVELPDLEITPVHRSDGSGTTKNFTDYLSKASTSWSYEAADDFPVQGEAAEGTSGVIQQATSIEGAITYADNSQVEDLGRVSVKVGQEYVAPSPEGAAKVLEVSPPAEGVSDVDMAVALDRTTTESGAYPVVLLSYLVACQSYDDAETQANVKGFLEYVVSDEGQQVAAEEAGSAPLGSETASKAQEIVASIGG